MGDRDATEAVRRRLQPAALSGDPAAGVAAVPDAIDAGLLQAAVPVAIVALRHGASVGLDLHRLVDALTARGWDGDDVAVEALHAARSGTPTGRTEIPADLEMLGDVLGQQLGGYLELATGDAWPASVFEDGAFEDDGDPDEDTERWLYVPGDSRDAWQDMADFAAHAPDPHVRELLQLAIEGRGAFNRFKSALDRHPSYWCDWHVWSGERAVGRARSWLASEGYDPLP
ncbi:MAG: hypothetical protein AB7O74_15005 [Candidatus Nanopelagicales bacterium]|uniref:hypothetical protein n=1 Tax=Pseudonocardia sp. TaxID=60912 RepID=UPI003D0C04F7